MNTINVYENGIKEHFKWVIELPDDKEFRKIFEQEVIKKECLHIGPKDYYNNFGELGGYYINNQADKLIIGMKRLKQKFDYELNFVMRKGIKLTNKEPKRHNGIQSTLLFLT